MLFDCPNLSPKLRHMYLNFSASDFVKSSKCRVEKHYGTLICLMLMRLLYMCIYVTIVYCRGLHVFSVSVCLYVFSCHIFHILEPIWFCGCRDHLSCATWSLVIPKWPHSPLWLRRRVPLSCLDFSISNASVMNRSRLNLIELSRDSASNTGFWPVWYVSLCFTIAFLICPVLISERCSKNRLCSVKPVVPI